MLFLWFILFRFYKWLFFFLISFFFPVFFFFIFYLIFFFFINLIFFFCKFIYSLRKDRIFRKSFLNDLIFYRFFTYNFYETYSQLNFNYIYYPVFYFQSSIFLVSRAQNERYYELLDELDAMETSSEIEDIQKVVAERLMIFEETSIDAFLRFIFHYTNSDTIYSFFILKDHNIFKHFDKIQGANDYLIKFDKATFADRIFVWKDFIGEIIEDYYDYFDSEEFWANKEEKDLFSYWPSKDLPRNVLKSLYKNIDNDHYLKEFFKTDYSIYSIIKNKRKKKKVKRILTSYLGHKKFLFFFNYFINVLDYYFFFRNWEIRKAGYFTFTDSLYGNFHFSNFLFFSHVYLQIWENFQAEIQESLIYEFKLDFVPYRYYYILLFFFYLFFSYHFYFFISNNIIFFILFLFFHSFFLFFIIIIFFIFSGLV